MGHSPTAFGNAKMKTFSILLFTLFAVFSVAYTLNSKKQDDDGDVKALMKELMKGVVVQMQEEEDQRSSAELESALSDLLSQVQEDDDDEGGREQDDDDEGGRKQDDDDEGGRKQDDDDGLLALLQEEGEGDDGARRQDDDDEGGRKQDDDDGLLALLQEEGEGDDGARRQDDDGGDLLSFLQDDDNNDGVEMQDDEGGDAIEQGFFGRLFGKIRRFGGRVRNVCNRVSRYSRALNCLPRMQAEMQKADDGDDDLAKDLLRRIANLQGEDDGDAEAQFFKSIFRGVRKLWKRGRSAFKRIRRRVGGLVRGYRNVRRCMRRYG